MMNIVNKFLKSRATYLYKSISLRRLYFSYNSRCKEINSHFQIFHYSTREEVRNIRTQLQYEEFVLKINSPEEIEHLLNHVGRLFFTKSYNIYYSIILLILKLNEMNLYSKYFNLYINNGYCSTKQLREILKQLSQKKYSSESLCLLLHMVKKKIPLMTIDVNRVAFTFPKAEHIVQLFEKLKSLDVYPNCVTYSIILSVSDFTFPELDYLLSIYNECMKKKEYPSPRAFYSFLKKLSTDTSFYPSSTCDKIILTIYSMIKMNIPMNASLFMFGITFCSKCARVSRAEEMIKKMKIYGIQPDLQLYTSLISLYTVNNQFPKALKTFQDMQIQKIYPNIVTLNNLLKYCAKTGDVEVFMHILEEMKKNGLEPDKNTLAHLLYSYVRSKNYNQAFGLFEVLREKNLVMTRSYRAVLLASCLSLDYKKCINYLKELRRDFPNDCPISSFVKIIDTFPDTVQKEVIQREFLDYLKSSNKVLTCDDISTILRLLVNHKHDTLARNYFHIFSKVFPNSISPDHNKILKNINYCLV